MVLVYFLVVLTSFHFFAGINTGLAPMYLSEIAPVSLRGLCGVFNQLSITFGVLMSQVIGLKEVLGQKHTWQFALGIVNFVSVMMMLVQFMSDTSGLKTRSLGQHIRQSIVSSQVTACLCQQFVLENCH